MVMKMTMSNDEMDFNVIIHDSEVARENILKACGKVLKARAVGNLNAIRSEQSTHKHLADDVTVKIDINTLGYKSVKIGGGSKTGTLWHIVNDGTYKNRPTHFMDRTISESQVEIESIIDQEMRKVGF